MDSASLMDFNSNDNTKDDKNKSKSKKISTSSIRGDRIRYYSNNSNVVDAEFGSAPKLASSVNRMDRNDNLNVGTAAMSSGSSSTGTCALATTSNSSAAAEMLDMPVAVLNVPSGSTRLSSGSRGPHSYNNLYNSRITRPSTSSTTTTPKITPKTDAERERDREIRRRDRLQKQRALANPQPQQANPFEKSFAVVVPPAVSKSTSGNSDQQQPQFDSTPTRISKREQIFQTLAPTGSSSTGITTATASTATSTTSTTAARNSSTSSTTIMDQPRALASAVVVHQQDPSTSSRSAKWLELTATPTTTISSTAGFDSRAIAAPTAQGENHTHTHNHNYIGTSTNNYFATASSTLSARRQSSIHERKSSTNAAQLSAAAALLAANFSDEHPTGAGATSRPASTNNTAIAKGMLPPYTTPPAPLPPSMLFGTLPSQPKQNSDTTAINKNSTTNPSWALKIRILSAVDLPSSISPSSPLCPLLKCGLVTDPELTAECEAILQAADATTKLPPLQYSSPDHHHPTNHTTNKDISLLKDRLNSEVAREAEQSRIMRLSGAVQQLGIAHMPFVHSNIRYTTGKIVLNKTDNGTAEFQEEFRWDGLTNPLAATLVIELCARSVPPQQPTQSTHSSQRKPNVNESVENVSNSFLASSTTLEGENATSTEGSIPSKSLNIDPSPHLHSSSSSIIINNNKPLDSGTHKFVLDSSTSPTPVVTNATKTTRGNLLGSLWQRRPRITSSTLDGSGTNTPERGKINIHETANAAAAVAKFIMEGTQQLTGSGSHHFNKNNEAETKAATSKQPKKSSESAAARTSRRGSSGSRAGRNSSRRRFENASIGWIECGSSSEEERDHWSTDDEEESHNEAEEAKTTGSVESCAKHIRSSKINDHCAELVDDLRLASLAISLSRLPFDGKKASVSRWYSMALYGSASGVPSSPATASCQHANNNTSALLSFTVANPTSGTPLPATDGNSIVMANKRNPSVLVELNLTSTRDLDDAEDDVDGEKEVTSLMWGDDEQSERALNGSEEENEKEEENRGSRDQGVTAESNVQTDIRKLFKDPTPKNDSADRQRKGASTSDFDEPVLEPGIVDYIFVVGPKSIGSQRNDDGSKGWVESSPEVCVLERFPKTDDFHLRNGRAYAILPNMVEWFCFPESCKLWRGTDPPTHFDLKPRSSSSLPSHTISAFDSCLKCASNFTWFVISSTGENYGSKTVKTYGAVIRFFAPAPYCIDATQDDYAQFHTVVEGDDNGVTASSASDRIDGGNSHANGAAETCSPVESNTNSSMAKQWSWSLKRKRLWVPLAICLTSQLPIIGILEAMLLQFCETLASKATSSESFRILLGQVHVELAHLIVNFSSPIPGVLNCSIPFLGGERLHVTQPPPAGLPPLPHGSCITAVCRLLGAEGLTTLLAAVLTECKIIIHSSDISNLAMVAETVVGALIYPFSWALPYIPVLPEAMLEFVEAPLSYFLGVPTSVMKCIDKSLLKDIVVFDLDQAGSPDYFDGGRRDAPETKKPKPLPAAVSSSITKAVFRLLQQEEEVEEEFYSKSASFASSHQFLPRLESESLAEREFRVSVARQICGLLRGYQECLFFVSSSQPVFNRERFLRNAPALFEQRKGSMDNLDSSGRISTFLSPRAKRFLSLLVNTQHFHQLLERLDNESTSFFHEVMDTFESDETSDSAAPSGDDAIHHLCEILQKLEDKIPTFRVDRFDNEQLETKKSLFDSTWEPQKKSNINSLDECEDSVEDTSFNFVHQLLLPITVPGSTRSIQATSINSEMTSERGVKSLSVELLVELESHPWRYNGILDLPSETQAEDPRNSKILKALQVREKVEVKNAIGERRFRVFKLMLQQKKLKNEDSTSTIYPSHDYHPIDLNSLLSVNEQDLDGVSEGLPPPSATHVEIGKSSSDQNLQDNKDRDAVRRCLERAYEGASQTRSSSKFHRRGSNGSEAQQEKMSFLENGRDLIQEAEAALRNPSAQRFLLTVLSNRARFETQRRARSFGQVPITVGISRSFRKSLDRMSVSRLVPAAFECLARLCCAMLEACVETQDYDAAYTLLTYTTGFCTVKQGNNAEDRMADGKYLSEHNESLQNQVVYMTARIGMHAIFADVRLWERVLQMHLQGRLPNSKDISRPNSSQHDGDKPYTNEYEAAVSTLYEMVAFGVPAEELALFATRVSEARGWFSSEKGQSLLLLARRLGLRRGDVSGTLASSGSGNVAPSVHSPHRSNALDSFVKERRSSVDMTSNNGAGIITDVSQMMEWQELSWVHPRRCLPASATSSRWSQGSIVMHEGEDAPSDGAMLPFGYEGRSAIASLASFGSSFVATGGVDGSVFLARLRFFDSSCSTSKKQSNTSPSIVHGVRVECGKDNGAVTCLAAAKGVGYKQASSQTFSDEDESFSSLEGCRIVGGTTGGALRVWCVKDIYATTSLAGNMSDISDLPSTEIIQGVDRDAQYIRSGQQSIANKLKWSLKGRALSGHRGGVTCLDVPSPIYRPESLLSGGADGLIKLWSLRHITRRSARTGSESTTSRFLGRNDADKRTSSNDAQETLSGHAGRVMCIKTAWHGDGMLSGGADKSVRLWDISTTGKCVSSFQGHSCWVTQTHFWGQNNIVSASTDRSIALWDARNGAVPLFIIRYHKSPVSDVLIGSRNDPLLVSASGDGTIATWDFRSLSSSSDPKCSLKSRIHSIRIPAATMNHCLDLTSNTCCGAIFLARGTGLYERSVISASIDGHVKEWDIQTGKLYYEQFTKHTDAISCLSTFTESDGLWRGKAGSASSVGGTITCSWDGTVRLKSLLLRRTSDG